MATEQTILFTVVPRAISVNGASTPVSVFVSPRLDGADRLGAFPDWLNWARHVRDDGLELELHSGAHTQLFAVDGAVVQPALWQQLFNADTHVRSHAGFDDYSERAVLSFPVRETLSALKSIYQQAGVTLALPDPPRRSRGDDRMRNRQRLAGLVAGLDAHWDGREARGMRKLVGARDVSLQALAQPAAPLDAEGLLVVSPDAGALRALATPFSVFHHMPTPDYCKGVQMPERDKLLDFHQALTALNSYPGLLRALGIVFDLDLPNGFLANTPFDAPGMVSVRRVLPGWRWALAPKTHPLETAYMKLAIGHDTLFFAAPRAARKPKRGEAPGPTLPGSVIGLLDLDEAHFGLAQVDVDGAMHKTIMLAETLHPAGGHNLEPAATPQPAQHPEVFDPEATLPSLRSGGFSLYADKRAMQLLKSIKDAKAFNAAIGGAGAAQPFYAEDLVRGYRLDVWDSRTAAWHSLHRRDASYLVGALPFVPPDQPEEGFVELAATQCAPGAKDHDKELYLHEAIARWAGWSLSVPRPGRHLSRYADPKDAVPRDGEGDKFAEDQPETPFRVAATYTLVPGSLPALRFGTRYRLRARAVDLAGNSLRFDDKLADNLARAFAIPREAEGFAYLRFEPVPAPLIVIRAEAALSAPGSALDRLVIRTFNDGLARDADAADVADAERHIIPPRAALDMGERHGSFDDAAGKLTADAATWKLMAARDLGELKKQKIVIKGRPAPADGSDEYPVEPGDSIDPLPFFPDPLARGAALRDLPGTPGGTIGRAVPAAGAAAPVGYQALSDPNPRPGSATLVSFDESGDWQQARGFRLVLAEPVPGAADRVPDWDPAGRVLTVYLAKGRTQVVPLTSYLSPADLKLMGVWQWLREYIDQLTVTDVQVAQLRPGTDLDRIAHVLQRAVEGGHWMLTPPHLLTLVHAVQQPVGQPEFTAAAVDHAPAPGKGSLQTTPGRGRHDPTELAAVTAWRRLDANDAYLMGALKIHGASTGRVDLLATWDDPFDDLTLAKWTTIHHAAPVDELPLPAPVDGYLTAPGAPNPDPRHVGYYDGAHDQVLFVRAGDNTTWNDYDFDEAAPRHLLGDTRHHVVRYSATASSRYREYFDPTLKAAAFARTSEAVVVDVPASARPLAPEVAYVVPTFGWERQSDTNLMRSVRFGGGLRVYLERPWFASGEGELLGVALWTNANGPLDEAARDRLKPYFTQWGMDPIWQTDGLAGTPGTGEFPDADDTEEDLSLEEASARRPDGSPGRVSVAGFAPQYDESRRLWFADLTINLYSRTYMPFVRLALVRYQPHALPDAKISRVVLADFAQLTPDRSAMVSADPHHPRMVRVVVSGVAPRGPAAVVQARPMPAQLSERPTRITLRVQQRDATIASDLAWNDAPDTVAKVTPQRDETVEGPDLALWAGLVEFSARPAPGQFRLVIEEHEFISANYTVTAHGQIEQPGRLVYAEIFPLDQAFGG